MDLLSLQDFTGGALQEKVNAAMQKVLDNIQDQNTPWKNKRYINIKIAFQSNENRDDVAVEVSANEKLAPVSPIVTRMLIGKDLRTGENYAQEYGKQVRGQMTLDDYQTEQIIGPDVVNTDTGEIVGNIKNFKVAEG